MDELFSLSNVAMSVVYSVVVATLFLCCSLFLTGALQQSGYSNKKFRRWFARKDNMAKHRVILCFLLMFFSAMFLAACFSFLPSIVSNILSVCAVFFFAAAFVMLGNRYALKVPLKMTARVRRLLVVYFVCLLVFNYVFITLCNVASFLIDHPLAESLKYVPLGAYFLLLPATLTFSNALTSPFERAHNGKLIRRASEKLKESGAVTIGITGSYGKTSVKNCLATILGEKYRVLATPASFNTPVGVAKCIQESSLEGVDFFLCEMGARKIGDVEELCSLFPPAYGIITGVCEQHLESFISLENIVAEKKKLAQHAKKGCAMPESLTGESDTVLFGDKVYKISDVRETTQSTAFKLSFDGKTLDFSTKLLSAHSAKNIALAVAIAVELGFSDEQLLSGVEKICEVEHRLQIVVNNGVTVLDDGYNANIVGAKDAVRVLKLFGGKKIIVTPGIVELGILEKSKNEEFGKQLVGLDRVILVGETLVGCIKEGYLSAGGDPARLFIVPTLEKAKEILREEVASGDAVLFVNDLPDVF